MRVAKIQNTTTTSAPDSSGASFIPTKQKPKKRKKEKKKATAPFITKPVVTKKNPTEKKTTPVPKPVSEPIIEQVAIAPVATIKKEQKEQSGTIEKKKKEKPSQKEKRKAKKEANATNQNKKSEKTSKKTSESSSSGSGIVLQKKAKSSGSTGNAKATTIKSKKKEKKDPKEKTPRKITPTNTNPAKDKKFQATIAHIEKSAVEQQTHKPANEKVAEVEKAAKLPESDQSKKNDQLQHIGAMDAVAEKSKETPFTAATFKTLLKENLKTLEADLPTNEAGAEKFKKEKPIDKVKKDISGQVKDENAKLSGPMAEQIKQKEPPASGLPTEKEEKLPFDPIGKAPKPIDAKGSVPKKKHSSEISMEDESASLDEYMAENELTEDQLAKSNEPKFTGALQSTNDAKQKAAEAPKKYRGKESVILNGAQGTAAAQGSKGLNGMFADRAGSFVNVGANQLSKEQTDGQQQKIIFKKLEGIYNDTKTAVEKKLSLLSKGVDLYFSTEAESAKNTFEKNVEKKLSDIYGWFTIDDAIFGADEVAIEKVFVEEKERFISKMDSVLDKIATLIAEELNASIALINEGRKESEDYFNDLDEDQKKLAGDAMEQFSGQYDSLEETVREKEQELAQELATSYKKNVDSLRASFDSIKESVSATWIEAAFTALKAVVDAIIAIKDLFVNLLVAVIEAVGAIIQDPIGFLSNLITGIKEGFLNFGANIKKHLITGLIEWLTGSLGGVGITLPKNLFSLGGIFDLSMQIMGLTWDYFRAKAVKLIGEPVVKAMETGFEMFQIIREKGIAGIWEYIKESFTDLKETVMDGIRDMIISKVVEAGIKWIIGLMNPAGAFVKAAMMIIDIVKFFVERAAQIFELVTAFTNSIRELATGNVAGVAKGIEKALAKALPVMIGFLASLLGITGLTQKVQKIIKKIRKRVDKAMDKMIAKAKKWGKKLFSRKQGKKNKKQKNKDIASGKLKDTEVGKVVPFKAGKEGHKLWIDTSGKGANVMMASTPETLENKFKRWDKKADKLEDEADKTKTQQLIAQAKSLNSDVNLEAGKVEELIRTAQKKPQDEQNTKKAKQGDDSIEKKEENLKNILVQLLDKLDNIFEIPRKIRKYVGQRIITRRGEPRYLAGFKSVVEGTNYKIAIKKSGTDNPTFYISRHDATLSPPIFINNDILEIGKEREYTKEHDKYKPDKIIIGQDGTGVYKARYVTKTINNNPGPVIKVDISFVEEVLNETKNKKQHRTVSATGLKFKPGEHGRGKTDSGNSFFHNSHLIGDRFGGSGFNEGLNVLLATKEYNTGSAYMKGKENELAKILQQKDASFKYDMKTSAEISEEVENPSELEKILKKEFTEDLSENKIDDLNNHLKDDAKKKIVKSLRSAISKDMKGIPGQFLNTSYLVVENTATKGKLFEDGIQEDIFYQASLDELAKERTSEGTTTISANK
ncbi:hypothetical protein [Aquimarina addita]